MLLDFPESNSYKTRKNALKKIEAAENASPEIKELVRFCVMQREDGRYVPLAIMNNQNACYMGALSHFGICCSN